LKGQCKQHTTKPNEEGQSVMQPASVPESLVSPSIMSVAINTCKGYQNETIKTKPHQRQFFKMP